MENGGEMRGGGGAVLKHDACVGVTSYEEPSFIQIDKWITKPANNPNPGPVFRSFSHLSYT